MSGRKSKLFAAILALLINAAGGPMTWARAAVNPDAVDAASQVMQHCAGEMGANGEQRDDVRDRDTSCCSGGSCTCGCLPAAPASRVAMVRTLLSSAAEVTTVIHAVPIEPLEDPLRPPIH